MSTRVRSRRLNVDLAITLGFAALFVWAILQARGWSFRAALFPVITASIMLSLVLLKLVLDVSGFRLIRADEPTTVGNEKLIEEDEATEAELEDVFATAPRPVWLSALAWMATFFILVWALGMLVAVPLFAFTYLLVASRERPLWAGLYAVLAWAFMYGLFDQVLHIALPTSALVEMLG